MGKDTKIKLRITPRQQTVDPEYILSTLFNLTDRKEKKDLVPAAKEILEMVSTRGQDGLYSEDWEQTARKLKISQSQYFTIIRTLKNAGLIYKSKGRFYLSKRFIEHMKKMYTGMRDYWLDLGAE